MGTSSNQWHSHTLLGSPVEGEKKKKKHESHEDQTACSPSCLEFDMLSGYQAAIFQLLH